MTSITNSLNAFIDSNQKIYAFGSSSSYYGKDPEEFKKPITMDNYKWKKISVGEFFMAGIQEDNTLWVKGHSQYGRLGVNENADNVAYPNWTQIGTDRKWKDVSCGKFHMITSDENGDIWTTGTNTPIARNVNSLDHTVMGVINGTKTSIRQVELIKVITNRKIEKVYACFNRNYMIDVNGDIYAFGAYDANTNYKYRKFLDSSSHSGAESDYYSSGFDRSCMKIGKQNLYQTNAQFTKVEGGLFFAYALTTEGYLFYQGENYYGEVPTTNMGYRQKFQKDDSNPQKWKDFSCGGYHIIAIAEDGTLWSRGHNAYGQLGDGTANDRDFWVKISDEQWSSVYCGQFHSTAIKEDGTVWTFGNGSSYALGTGINNLERKPVNITPKNIDVYKCAENIVTKKYVVNQKAIFKFTIDAIPKLYSIIPKGSFPATSGFLMQFSDDNATWKTFDSITSEWKSASSNDEGITVSEIDSITDDNLSWLSDKEFYIKAIMWTTDENSSAILNGFDAKLYMNLNSPQVASLNISAMKAEIDKADFAATRANFSNPVYTDIKEDAVSDISTSTPGEYLKIKADINEGQTIDALSYSHN